MRRPDFNIMEHGAADHDLAPIVARVERRTRWRAVRRAGLGLLVVAGFAALFVALASWHVHKKGGCACLPPSTSPPR